MQKKEGFLDSKSYSITHIKKRGAKSEKSLNALPLHEYTLFLYIYGFVS